MECAKERCISWIKEKAGCVTQVEFKENSKEVCMIRACRIMQEARPAIEEALQGIKALGQRLIDQPKTDLSHSKEALQNMYKALRPINKALRPLLPFITSEDDQSALTKRWHQSCISEAHRLLDKFWDSKLMSCLFSKERIKQAQIELLRKAYDLIRKTSGLFPIEKELLFRIEEIDQALLEIDHFEGLIFFPMERAGTRMFEVDYYHLFLDLPTFEELAKKKLKNSEEFSKRMKKRIVLQNNPSSLQKRCVEIIYLHVLDHGLDCDVQNQIHELFERVSMPAEQEMINLHNYIFMGWANPV